MLFVLFSFIVLITGGLAAFLVRNGKSVPFIGPCSAIAGCLLAIFPALAVLLGLQSSLTYEFTAEALPMGSALLLLDPLSALFLAPAMLVACVCAGYGLHLPRKECCKQKFRRAHWLFYNLLVLGLILTFMAADAFTFMVAWEIMSIAPFFLIISNDEDERVRKGASSYIIAAHIGGLFLLAFFILISAANGGMLDFATFTANAGAIKASGVMFIFAFLGFGTKAGLMPMHVWLPEAHPAAPGHISAVMSGVMINTGIYGIMRALTFLGASQNWWAFALIGVGLVSAILGILFAMSEKSIKRALAFSSIENMGIVCMALGFSLYAAQHGNMTLALVCALGGMLHLVNHSLYKCLLFLGAGAVANGAGTDLINKLGGLQKRAPLLSLCFFAGAAAICALPPLNGFAGKFILFMGFAHGGSSMPDNGVLYWAGLVTLASVSGFSLLCFTRIFGLGFLGIPRSKQAAEISSPPNLQGYILGGLALLCLVSALLSPFMANSFIAPLTVYFSSIDVATGNIFHLSMSQTNMHNDIFEMLSNVSLFFILFLALFAGVYLWRQLVLRSRTVSYSPTWDCGYAMPSSRIQYTGGSFSQAAIYYTGFILRPKALLARFAGFFPSSGKAELSTEDWLKTSLYSRLFIIIARISLLAKRLQIGRANMYILYIFITLVVLLAWKIR